MILAHALRRAAPALLAAAALALAACTCQDEMLGPWSGDRGAAGGDGPRDGAGGEAADLALSDAARKEAGGDLGSSLLPHCRRACTTTADCCASGSCDKGKDAQKCSGGRCQRVGCSGDGDCKVLGLAQGTCKQVQDPAYGISYGLCAPWCTTDAQCQTPEKCVAALPVSSSLVCGDPCTKDLDCAAPNICVGNKFCGSKHAAKCKSDSDCSPLSGLLRCHAPTGRCYCADSATCQTALGTRLGGTWICL